MAIISKILNTIPRPQLIKLSNRLRPIIALFLKGTKYTDPIDGKSYRKFLPYGYQKIRKNVLAPGTFSLERHRLFWIYLKKETDFFSPTKKKVLHFAPEQAFFNQFKKIKKLNYTTTDLSSPLADVKADICNLPFKDNEFDYVISINTIHNLPIDNCKTAIKEISRVAKKDAFITVDASLR